jgi:hypothetical protein
VSCGAEAAQFRAENGFRLWVTRRGAIAQGNPLRPAGNRTLRVLQVSIDGRAATAYGPDYATLERGGTPEQLEEAFGQAIRWEPRNDRLPDTLQFSREPGAAAPPVLRFAECGRPPAARPAPRAAPAAPAAPAPRDEAPRGLPLPQGALN